MRASLLLALSALALALTGCEPIVAIDARVAIPAGALAAYSGAYPAQVIVTDDHDTHEIGAPPHAYRVGVVCSKTEAPLRFRYHRGGIGCADETHLVAYLAPILPAEARATCGPIAEPLAAPTPPALRPSGAATVFADQKGDCGNHSATTDITLADR